MDHKEAVQKAETLIGKMTLREKAGQVNQRLYGFGCYKKNADGTVCLMDEFKNEVDRYSGMGALYGLYRADPWSQRDKATGLSGRYAKEAYITVQKYVMEHSRLSIPVFMSSECPHGHQAVDGYLLPVNLACGAAFDPELYRRAVSVCGRQLRSVNVHLALMSMLDVLRDPRWGRSEECYSEDPYLCAEYAKSAVKGMQDDAGVKAVAKHFAAQGECTGGINASAARIGERELHEIHIPAMRAAAAAGVCGVMAAYNEIDGVPCHANAHLLRDILRGELGFDGIVMADGVAIDRLDELTGDNTVSAALAMKAGVNIGLWDRAYSNVEEAVNIGILDSSLLDEAVLHVLTLKYECGLFEHPFGENDKDKSFYYETFKDDSGCESNDMYDRYLEALELARGSVILLENKNETLPLAETSKGKKILVTGPNAADIYDMLGDYTPPAGNETVSILDSINKLSAVHGNKVVFSEGCTHRDSAGHKNDEEIMIQKAADEAGKADVVIAVLGGTSSRYTGRTEFDINGAAVKNDNGENCMDCGEGVDRADLRLPEKQLELIKRIHMTGTKTVTVIVGGRPYIAGNVAEYSDALMYAFYPGPMGGRAIAEIIYGITAPSGHLPASLPDSMGQLPVYYDYKDSYPGMTYSDIKHQGVRYPFGYGLSYTEFVYKDIRLSEKKLSRAAVEAGTGFTVSFSITNTGRYDGYAVPQLYIHRITGAATGRVRELKAFGKVYIKKGGTAVMSLSLGRNELTVYDSAMCLCIAAARIEVILSDSRDIYKNEIEITSAKEPYAEADRICGIKGS